MGSPDETGRETVRCSYCDRRFASEHLRSLHHGSEHTHELTETEWNTVETARESEADAVRSLRLRVLVGLVVLYFGFLLLYLFV